MTERAPYTRHVPPHPGVGYQSGCEQCRARKASHRARSPIEQERVARGAARRAASAQRAAERAAEQERDAADREYVTRMLTSGRARNLRRALGIGPREAEALAGVGRTALVKYERAKRLPGVKRHRVDVVRGLARVFREWEAEAERRGLDPDLPRPRLNGRLSREERAER